MNTLLIDDEVLALKYLESMLLNIPGITVTAKLQYPEDAKKYIRNHAVDVVFLDIHMPETNGIELAEQLLEINPYVRIVFVTAYDHYALKAFELNAMDYVMKPVRMERLMVTVQRIRDRLGESEQNTAVTHADSPSIRMKLFQNTLIESEDGQFVPLRWRTTKAQELFLYLLQHRGSLVRKSTLIELLWPEQVPEKAYSQLYTAVYHIRKTLAAFKDRFQIENVTEGYIMRLDRVHLDVEEWEEGLSTFDPHDAQALERMEAIMALCTGEYLQEYAYWWAESERERLKALWVRHAFLVAKAYVDQDQMDKAMEKYQEIATRQPIEEEAHLALMKWYASQNNEAAVHRQYQMLESIMQEQLEEQPGTTITQWYTQWKEQRMGG